MLGTTLDVAIGVIFIFMLFSLFLSSALEIVATALKLRARALEIAIAQLIQDPDAVPIGANWPANGGFGLVGWLHKQKERIRVAAGGPSLALLGDAVDSANPERYEGPTEPPDDITPSQPLRFRDVYEHPLVGAIPGRRPSYVPNANFASALLYAIGGGGQGSLHGDLDSGIAALPQGPLRTALTTAMHEAQGDIDKLRQGIERWYDNAMDRLSGQYKRFTQGVTFLLALVLAASFNVDAITIGERLYTDSILRETLAGVASNYVDKHQTATATPTPAPTPTPVSRAAGPPATAKSDDPSIIALQTAISNTDTARDELVTALDLFKSKKPVAKPDYSWAAFSKHPLDTTGALLLASIGVLVTALAGMLGAPFWFEMLQRLVNLRGSGPKPTKVQRGDT
jgi:hypothetical protein